MRYMRLLTVMIPLLSFSARRGQAQDGGALYKERCAGCHGAPAGRVPALYPPGLTARDEPVMAAVPALGEHTEAVLRGLGYDETRIAGLRERGVV